METLILKNKNKGWAMEMLVWILLVCCHGYFSDGLEGELGHACFV